MKASNLADHHAMNRPMTRPAIVNVFASLHGPWPASFHVWIHQFAAPCAIGVEGVTEQIPLPEGQLDCAEVYQAWIFGEPTLSWTQS